MRSVEELLSDLRFVAKYEYGREYNEIDIGQLIDDAAVRIRSLLVDLEDVSRRYRECAANASELYDIVSALIHYVPRVCDTCKHWVAGGETPHMCDVGGCKDFINRENWEWGYERRAGTLFSKLSKSPEDMADFLVDRTVLCPCDVICGGVCTAVDSLRGTGKTQCKKRIVDFLNQRISSIEEMDETEQNNKVCLTQAQKDTTVMCLEHGRMKAFERNGADCAYVGQERNLNEQTQ